MYESEFSERYVAVMRGGQDLYAREYSRDPDLDKLIDVDIAPPSPVYLQYDTLHEVRADLEDLAADVPADEKNREVLSRTIGANILYLRALAGETIDFETYVEGTIGTRPQPVDEEKIKAGADALDILLGDEGMRYDAAYRDRFQKRFMLTGRRDIRRAFQEDMASTQAALDQYLEVPDDGLEITYVNKDVYWVALVSGDRAGLNLAVNMHKRHPLSLGRIATINAHEYGGHAAHLRLWSQEIDAGTLNPAIGITSANATYAVQAEALAQNAEHILPDDSWENIFYALYNQQATRVMHNMHYQVNTGHDPKEVQRYGRERLPLEPEEKTDIALIEDFKDNPLLRTYIAAYQPAQELLAPVRSLPLEGRRAVMQKLYTGAFMPAQIDEVVSDVVAFHKPIKTATL